MDRIRGRASGIGRWGESNCWLFGLSDRWLSGATLSVQMILCIIFVLAMPCLAVAVDF
jgi:hypothetical protein